MPGSGLRTIHDRLPGLRGLHARFAALEKRLITQWPTPARMLPLPHILGIGATKAGTTWLYRVLDAHPDVYFPRHKEQHYFDRHYDATLMLYASRYWRGRGTIRADITPAYSVLPPDRIRFVRTIMPDARVIFIMRDPIARTWSEAMHILLRKGDYAGPNKRRLEDVPRQEILDMLNAEELRLRSDYERILDNWLSVFPREQVYITFFERISTEPEQLLREVCEHAGINPDIDWSGVPVRQKFNTNPSTTIPAEPLALLHERYDPMIERLAERFGAPVEAWRS